MRELSFGRRGLWGAVNFHTHGWGTHGQRVRERRRASERASEWLWKMVTGGGGRGWEGVDNGYNKGWRGHGESTARSESCDFVHLIKTVRVAYLPLMVTILLTKHVFSKVQVDFLWRGWVIVGTGIPLKMGHLMILVGTHRLIGTREIIMKSRGKIQTFLWTRLIIDRRFSINSG